MENKDKELAMALVEEFMFLGVNKLHGIEHAKTTLILLIESLKQINEYCLELSNVNVLVFSKIDSDLFSLRNQLEHLNSI